jgi:CRISPR-associated protein Csd2
MESKYFKGKDVANVVDVNVDLINWFSATLANAQGDPLAGNSPRITPDGFGFVTPAGIKAKLRRRYAEFCGENIMIEKDAILDERVTLALTAAGIKIDDLVSDENPDPSVETPPADEEGPAKAKDEEPKDETKGKGKKGKKGKDEKRTVSRGDKLSAIKAVADYYHDFALFGGVLTKPFNVGVRGPIQFGMSFSVNPIQNIPVKITRMAVANQEEAKNKVSTMGDMPITRYGLYKTEISVNPFDAEKVGTTWGQLDQFVEALRFIWSHTRAGSRHGMAFERLDIFLHSKKGGSAPSDAVYRSVDCLPTEDPTSIKHFTFTEIPLRGVHHSTVELFDGFVEEPLAAE